MGTLLTCHSWSSCPGLHKLWYPGIRDTSTWSKFGAHGEHGDVFLLSNLGELWFSENRALVLGEFDIWIKIFIVCLFKGSQKQSFFLQALLFTAFLVTVLKMLTYTLVSTWSLVSSGYEHVKQLMQPCSCQCHHHHLKHQHQFHLPVLLYYHAMGTLLTCHSWLPCQVNVMITIFNVILFLICTSSSSSTQGLNGAALNLSLRPSHFTALAHQQIQQRPCQWWWWQWWWLQLSLL